MRDTWAVYDKRRKEKRPEGGRRQHTHIQDVDDDHGSEVELEILGVVVEAVVDDGDVGAGDEDANAVVVERLQDCTRLSGGAQEVVEDGASQQTADSAKSEDSDGPARNSAIASTPHRMNLPLHHRVDSHHFAHNRLGGCELIDGNGIGQVQQEDKQDRTEEMGPYVHGFVVGVEDATD